MPVGAYRCIEANGGDARWREFRLELGGGVVTTTEALARRSRSLADGEAVEIAKALTHPLRLTILRALRDGGRISPVEFARESGDLLGNVSHHLKALRGAGVIQIVGTEPQPRRGRPPLRARRSAGGRGGGDARRAGGAGDGPGLAGAARLLICAP